MKSHLVHHLVGFCFSFKSLSFIIFVEFLDLHVLSFILIVVWISTLGPSTNYWCTAESNLSAHCLYDRVGYFWSRDLPSWKYSVLLVDPFLTFRSGFLSKCHEWVKWRTSQKQFIETRSLQQVSRINHLAVAMWVSCCRLSLYECSFDFILNAWLYFVAWKFWRVPPYV